MSLMEGYEYVKEWTEYVLPNMSSTGWLYWLVPKEYSQTLTKRFEVLDLVGWQSRQSKTQSVGEIS